MVKNFMADTAFHDPRSVAAQLRGRGDGRHKRFQAFEKRALVKHPGLDAGQVSALFERYVATGNVRRVVVYMGGVALDLGIALSALLILMTAQHVLGL